MRPTATLFGLVLVLLLLAGAAACSNPKAEDEVEAVRQAASEYLEAEKSGEPEEIYELIAPGSEFKKKYSLENYRRMVGGGAVRVKSYKITDVYGLSDDVDSEVWPGLTMTAQVSVLVRLFDPKDGKTTQRTSILTFAKVDGKWYKS